MEQDKLMTAYMQELATQRSLLGDRALTLAAQLAEARERITELEKENGELKKSAPPRVVKST